MDEVMRKVWDAVQEANTQFWYEETALLTGQQLSEMLAEVEADIREQGPNIFTVGLRVALKEALAERSGDETQP